VICAWSETAERPTIPVPYSQETMHGYEYAAAELMIGRGLVAEGMRVVKGVRDRYDGEKRNPWNEIECGNNYARSMASYALLNVFSGFTFDMPNQTIGFNPILPSPFSCFWSLDSGWGEVSMNDGRMELKVLSGSLELKKLILPEAIKEKSVSAMLNGEPVACEIENGACMFAEPIRIDAGGVLVVE
jgi:non-lysosomal glucosylceramidase